jgi:hypothetical protein
LSLPLLSGDDTVVTEAHAQTLTNKTLTSPIISSISNTGTVTLPTSTDTLVGRGTTDTLTNKTISGASNTLSNIGKAAIPSSTVYNDQNNNLGTFYQDIGEIAAPSAPGADVRRVFVDSATGKLSVRTEGATTVSLEEQPNWSPTTTETLQNKTINALNNTFENVLVSPDKKLSGWTSPSAVRATVGTIGVLQALGTGEQGAAVVNSATDGKYVNYPIRTTSTVAGDVAGLRMTSGSGIYRAKNARFKAKFRVNSTSATLRLFVGLTSHGAVYETGDTPLSNISGVILTFRTTDSNFQIATNDGSASATYAELPAGATPKDTAIRTFEIRSTNAGGWQWSVDGGAFTTLTTTAVPAANGLLMPHCSIETSDTTGTSKSIDIWYMYIEQDP